MVCSVQIHSGSFLDFTLQAGFILAPLKFFILHLNAFSAHIFHDYSFGSWIDHFLQSFGLGLDLLLELKFDNLISSGFIRKWNV